MGHADAEDLLRQLAPQVLGALVRRYGHFDTAEDAVQEALLAAATQWPAEGLPGNPRGWLITVASRRLTDLLRGEQARQRREETAARRASVSSISASSPATSPSPGSRRCSRRASRMASAVRSARCSIGPELVVYPSLKTR